MRLTCPNCTAQYEVAAGAIPTAGRDVQCANCSHIWFQNPTLVLDTVEKIPPELAPEYEPAATEPDAVFRSYRSDQAPTPVAKAPYIDIAEPETAPTIIAQTELPKLKLDDNIKNVLQSEAAYASEIARPNAQDTSVINPNHGGASTQHDTPTGTLQSAQQPDGIESIGDENLQDDEISQMFKRISSTTPPAETAPLITQNASDSVAAPITPRTQNPPGVPNFIDRLKNGGQDAQDQTSAQQAYDASVEANLDQNSLTSDALTELDDTPKPLSIEESLKNALDDPSSLAGDDIPTALDDDIVVKTSRKGKDVFADVDQIEGEIGFNEDEDDVLAAEGIDVEAYPGTIKRTGRPFWGGFYTACIFVVIATIVYSAAPYLIRYFPSAETAINGYTSAIDAGRVAVQNLYTDGGEPSFTNFAENIKKKFGG